MSKVLLAIDMDDTITNTQEEVALRLRRKLSEMGDKEGVKWVYNSACANLQNGLHSTMLYPEHYRNIINEEIILEGSYVTTVKPTNLVSNGGLTKMLFHLKSVLGPDLTTVIATHRGVENGVKENTIEWLDRYKIFKHLNDIHFIPSKKYSNKINYLKLPYPEHEIMLLDDNPFGDLHTVHAPNKSVLVYDELCKYEAYKHQNKFTSINALSSTIVDLAGRDNNTK